MELKFKIPGADEPGYLERVEKSLKFRQAENTDPESVTLLIDWLSEFVIKPKKPDEIRKALLQASRNQIDEMIDAINAVGIVSPEASGSSDDA